MEQQKDFENKKRNRGFVPAWVKTRWFFFFAALFFTIVGGFFLLCMDKNNSFRPEWLNVSFFNDWLPKAFGLYEVSDISMFSWFIFFIGFGILLIVATAVVWYKYGKQRAGERYCRKHQVEEFPKKNRVLYTLIFFGSILLIAVAYAVLVGCFFSVFNPNVNIITYVQKQPDAAAELLKVAQALLLLLICLLLIPLCILVAFVVIWLIVKLISLIVGGVASTVFKSYKYQEASTNAKIVQDRIRDEVNAGIREARRARKNGATLTAGGKLVYDDSDSIFPGLAKIDVAFAEIEAQKAKEAKKLEEEAKKQAEIEASKTEEQKAEEAKAKAEAEAKAKEEELAKRRAEALANKKSGVKKEKKEEPLTVVDGFPFGRYQKFCDIFQAHLANKRDLYYKLPVLRAFVAALSASRLVFLQGLSGTGKSTLPREFMYFVGGEAKFFPVQASWRDKTDVLGFYSDLTSEYKETQILIEMYRASYTPSSFNMMVLDEMNIARPEYYFADFLSVFEYPSEDWLIKVYQPNPGEVLPKHLEGGFVRIPTNTWFIGTLNIDDSTYTLSDKIYDRCIAIDFEESNQAFKCKGEDGLFETTVEDMEKFFELCRKNPKFCLTSAEQAKFDELCQFVADTFEIKFGNRIIRQIQNFLPVYVALGGTKAEALDHMFATKVLRKLEAKYESYMDTALAKLERYIVKLYGKGNFKISEGIVKSYKRRFE